MGLIESAPKKIKFLVVRHNINSKWLEVAAADSIETKEISDLSLNRFTLRGVSERMVSDDGPQFISDEFEFFMKVHEIQ